MKTFNKTYLPDVIEYKGQQYKLNVELTNDYLRPEGAYYRTNPASKYHIQVNCLSNNLKGKTNLHGKPYQPTQWIYSPTWVLEIQNRKIYKLISPDFGHKFSFNAKDIQEAESKMKDWLLYHSIPFTGYKVEETDEAKWMHNEYVN